MIGEKIFITGGAGYLGTHLVQRYYQTNDITIYSRDEAKHYYLQKRFPKIKCVIGDIRNYDLLLQASRNHTIGIFAASLKQIGSVDQNVTEGTEIIINGALNSRRVAEENNFKASTFISSDKSRAATTLYGAMKFVAGEAFIVNAEESNVKLSTIIYGNVMNSTGSIIPLIWNAINNKYSLTLYSEEMTRFMISIAEAINVIEAGLEVAGYNVIPNLKSFLIKDLFEIYNELFGLEYTIGVPRISEKIHETMITKEETPRSCYNVVNNCFYMHYKNIFKTNCLKKEYNSKNHAMNKKGLKVYLKAHNYFKSGGA